MQSCRQIINVNLASRTMGLGLTERRLAHGSEVRHVGNAQNVFLTFFSLNRLKFRPICKKYDFSTIRVFKLPHRTAHSALLRDLDCIAQLC